MNAFSERLRVTAQSLALDWHPEHIDLALTEARAYGFLVRSETMSPFMM